MVANKQICSRCIYDTSIVGISFDEDGVCSYCHQVEEMSEMYGTGSEKGETVLFEIIKKIKKDGRGQKYDCIIGVSGGTDSSYLMLKAVEWGLRPLAVHYDNTWNSAIATMNISRVTQALNIDLYTHVVSNDDANNIKLAFMKAGVAEFDADTDIAFVQVLRSAAAKFGVKYIFEGHSFIAEGISPVGQNYLDGGYVEDIIRKFGNGKCSTFPNMTFVQFMKWVLVFRQKFIRPLWYIDYSKERAREELVEKTGWVYYGGHHLENRASSFAHTVWLPKRFQIDYRNLTLAALVRSGKMDRQEAIEIYRKPVNADPDLVTYLKKRLGLSSVQYDEIMQGNIRTFREFKTYKKRFEMLRPLFAQLARLNLIPMSFYLKYCFPIKSNR